MSESTWVPTPRPEAVSALQKSIAGYVLMPADDEVLDAAMMGIRRAIDRLNLTTWNWAITSQAITFVAGTQTYSLERPFKRPRNFHLLDTNGLRTGRLSYLPWDELLKETDETRDCLEYYSIPNDREDGLLTLVSSPTASFVSQYPSGVLTYYRRVPYPSVDTTMDVPSEATGYIQASAEYFVANRYDPNKVRDAKERSEVLFHEMMVDDRHGRKTDWE